jgi:hypothetical protein
MKRTERVRQQNPEGLIRSLRRKIKLSCTGQFVQVCCQTLEDIHLCSSDNNNNTDESITEEGVIL